MKAKRKWHDHMWIVSSVYLLLGLVNILFAWLGLLCFFIPILISMIKGNKSYCNTYCGRGQLFQLLGSKYKLSRYKEVPNFLRSKWFRYLFLIFFMTMFSNMLFITFKVFIEVSSLREAVTVFWIWKIPWKSLSSNLDIPSWIYQFAYGFYSVMLTSTLLGFITMFLYKPRSWCVYCPMGTMTQGICKIKNKAESMGCFKIDSSKKSKQVKER